MNWHTLNIEDTLACTASSLRGLDAVQVRERLLAGGYNQLKKKKQLSVWQLLSRQFSDLMILILVAAAVVSGFAGDSVDTIVILSIVFINAIVGFVQEYRAGKAMDALKKMAAAQALVIRSHCKQMIDAEELVSGDIVLLEAGDMVPADLRLIEVEALKVTEAALTGESVAIDKITNTIPNEQLPVADRLNMTYKGTQVTSGRGRGVVVATGMNTEIGQIVQLLQQEEPPTPLQKRMTDFGKKLSFLILVLCAALFVIGLLHGEAPLNMLLVALSLAVAAIPEALPALITIGLSRGANRLAKHHVLVRKLAAVETLGSVTVICTDKTGTLTQNKMEVTDIHPAANALRIDEQMSLLELAMCLNHDVWKDHTQVMGDATEIAMVAYVQKRYAVSLYWQVQQHFPRIAELPFDPDRKCMTTVHKYGEKYLVLSKGAAESIAKNLKKGEGAEALLTEAAAMASAGKRVLAFAYGILDEQPQHITGTSIETGLCFAGLVELIDPPRVEVKTAIAECKTAGIRPVMITGDHKATAAFIARQIGLLSGAQMVVSGNELSLLNDEELVAQVEKIGVYARVSPQQKLDIIKALQQKNNFVAMTGDGVNDAPSLQKANIGIAMGITGTDVSKEAADMILLDDNFATIIKAVKEGRRIYGNIRKFVKYIMTCNSAEIWTLFLAPLLGLPIPLLPVHILWINLITDGLPALALSSEKAEKNIMQLPPRKWDESLFAEGIGMHIVWVGILMAFLTLSIQAWAIKEGDVHWQTMVFTVLSLSQLAHVFAVRSDYEFIYSRGIFSNPFLLRTVVITSLLQLFVIYLPWANVLFKTQPLSSTELFICIGVAAILFHAVEMEKWIKMKLKAKQHLST